MSKFNNLQGKTKIELLNEALSSGKLKHMSDEEVNILTEEGSSFIKELQQYRKPPEEQVKHIATTVTTNNGSGLAISNCTIKSVVSADLVVEDLKSLKEFYQVKLRKVPELLDVGGVKVANIEYDVLQKALNNIQKIIDRYS